jgi:transposase
MSTETKKSQRDVILFHWNNGVHKPSEIHKITKIPKSTIHDNIRRIKEKGTNKHAGGKGQPKKITKSATCAIGQFIRHDSSISTRNIASKLENKGVEVSYRTVARHLRANEYAFSLPRKTPMLTEAQRQTRVDWARKHLNDNWKKTFFSDETSFQLFRNTVQRWHKGPRPVRRIPKDRTKIHAWGGFYIKGKSTLHCFRETMNADVYIGILREHIPEVKAMLGNRFRWQQDNDPKHNSHRARAFLEENVPKVIDWPSYSPDLNPIENLWGIVKRNVEKRMPKNLDELEQFMVEEWNKIPDSILKSLVDSMRNRCLEVIEKNGETISF